MNDQLTFPGMIDPAEQRRKLIAALSDTDSYVLHQLCRFPTTLEDELDEIERLHDRDPNRLSPRDASDAFWRLEAAGWIEIDKDKTGGAIRRIHDE